MGFSVEKVKSKTGSVDSVLLAFVVLLTGIGLAILFSVSYPYSRKLFKDPFVFFRNQALVVLLGIFTAFVLANVPAKIIKKYIPGLLLLSFILICLTFVPGIGGRIKGCNRWIFLPGFTFQPSELVKLSLILYLSFVLSKKEDKMEDFVNTIMPPLLIVLLFVTLVFFQKDLSTAAFIFFLSLSIFYIAKTNLLYLIGLVLIIGFLFIILLFTNPYWFAKVNDYFNPQSDPLGTGYQINMAIETLERGGVWGVGPGRSIMKYGRLPEAYSDFTFAVIGEEAGFVGVLFILTLFIAFGVRGYMVAINCKDKFCFFIAFGITTVILYQALLNMAIVSRLVPATGLPLPFFSHGGSSIFIILCMCGLLMNVSRYSSFERQGTI